MNTHDKIELPPLPEDLIAQTMTATEVRSLLQRYGERCATAATEADRKCTGEPVYLYRRKGQDEFVTCDKARYDELSDKSNLFDTRILYDDPQPAEPTRGSLPRHVAQTLADAIYKAAQKMGIANGDHSTLSVPQCLHLLDCMSHPAEPVKVPSNADLLALIREHAFRQYEFDDLLVFARALLARYGAKGGQ